MKRLAILIAGASLLAGCKDPLGEDVILAPIPPLAYTRFVNAVNDTGSTDWRFIDDIEYSPVEFGMTFRSFSPYAGTAPGERHLRIFPTSTDILVTQRHFIDTLISLEAGSYYTIIHIGSSRAAASAALADRVIVIEDQIPELAAANIASRFIHAGTGLVGQDVFAVDTTNSPIFGTSPTFLNVTFGTASNYNVNRAAGRLAFRSTNTGSFLVMASAFAPPGRAADPSANLSAVGGWSVAQSGLTGIFFPASISGSQAASFPLPGIVFLVDRHPN